MNKSDDGGFIFSSGSMTLRDWFAGQALIMAGTYRVVDDEEGHDSSMTIIAKKAYALADAMIAERSREA